MRNIYTFQDLNCKNLSINTSDKAKADCCIGFNYSALIEKNANVSLLKPTSANFMICICIMQFYRP